MSREMLFCPLGLSERCPLALTTLRSLRSHHSVAMEIAVSILVGTVEGGEAHLANAIGEFQKAIQIQLLRDLDVSVFA